jgi:hypothetical protein
MRDRHVAPLLAMTMGGEILAMTMGGEILAMTVLNIRYSDFEIVSDFDIRI